MLCDLPTEENIVHLVVQSPRWQVEIDGFPNEINDIHVRDDRGDRLLTSRDDILFLFLDKKAEGIY